ncbi:MAG TPA: DUF1553 domain-containing protein [Thermoanaerobaculia bacterium]|nr:DUF1553 domain-containing protein [Thermoanaerobaculia bacterium]
MRRIAILLLAAILAAGALAETRRRAVGKPAGPVVLPVANYIDTHIGAKLSGAGIAPAAIAGDGEFLRRIHLDLTGAIPAANEVTAFLADTRTDKRARKIDELRQSNAFTDRWTMWFGDLVQNVQFSTNSREYYLGRNVYYVWMHDSIRDGKPYDAMVREVLAGEGVNFSTGTANYVVRQLQRNGPPQDTYDNLAAHSAEKFLGLPMLCISCHDGAGHLETVNWYLRGRTRSDFWRMSAFFARTTTRGQRYTDPNNPNQNNILQFTIGYNQFGGYNLNTTDGNKSPRAPKAGEPATVTPAFLLTGEEPRFGEPYRVAYGRMLTGHRQFARATVNALWKEMFGTAIVEPVNAFDLAKLDTQPSHPELLEALADDFIADGYSLRELLRTIASSNAYQLSSAYNGTHPHVTYFARRQPRRLPAEVLFDAVVSVTGVPAQFNINGAGTVNRAMQIRDPLDARRTQASRWIDQFGRGNRDDIARSGEAAISQALALMNDPVVTSRIRQSNGTTTDPDAVADKLYLATLSRRPTEDERRIAVEYLREGNLTERAEDLQYVLLNSLEFLFN